MTWLEPHLIKEALAELADSIYQKRVWTGLVAGQASSPVEAIARLFDDSGLGDTLDAGESAFDEPTDQMLRKLERALKPLEAVATDVDAFLEDRRLPWVREAAAAALFEIVRAEARKSRLESG